MADTIVVTNNGLGCIVDSLILSNTYKYIAWGTGTTTATVSDIGLQNASEPTVTTAIEGVISKVTTSTAGDTYQIVGVITATGTLSITEIVIVNQATISGAVCFLRGTFDPINLDSGDSIEFTIKLQLDQA